MDALFFATPAEFRAWLEANYDTQTEVLVGFYKKAVGKPTMTYQESVDQALCFGWIDGIRRSIDSESYSMRFTPRKPHSIWSQINLKHIERLTQDGLMHESGLKTFNERDLSKQNQYSFEQDQDQLVLGDAYEAQLRANPAAWDFFENTAPPAYRKTAIWWVISAKQEATRQKRLATLIEDSAAGRRLKHLTPRTGSKNG